MPKVEGKAPEKRECQLKIRYTLSERKAVADKAKAADVCDTDYVRSLSLGTPLSKAPTAITADRILLTRALGALGDAGSLLQEILAVVAVGDIPLTRSLQIALSKVEMGAEAAMKALGSQ